MYDRLLNELSLSFDEKTAIDLSQIDRFLDGLEQGDIRCAQKISDSWQVDPRVKKGILLAFRHGVLEKFDNGLLSYIDKNNLAPQSFSLEDNIRIVPGGVSVRRGAFIGKNCVLMPPSFVNIGAFVDEGSMVDSNALVGSCAQVGKRVHISAGAQIGGVLEPLGAQPVIIEDDVLLGGHCGIFEGAHIGKKAVIGAGVIITRSTKVYDLVNERIILGQSTGGIKIPENAVVVPGARHVKGDFAHEHGLSIATPLIIKYRDEKTDSQTALEETLRK